MDAETWQKVSAIAEQALALADTEREEFIAGAVLEYPTLADEIRLVLSAAADPDGFANELSDRVAPILESESFVRGEKFGHYKIERTLGWGGMGAVYLAHRSDDQYEKEVALKVLPKLTETGASRERFLRERQVLANLEHPSIARLLDGGVTDFDQPYFVLEYVRGATASQFADAPKTTLDDVLAMFIQACDAVAYAHKQLVVHCDLKPSNVMVDESGRARLIDFGISRLSTEEAVGFTIDYLETPLTRNYASPELLAGSGVDTRSDIYSLGNLLFRLLTGKQRYQLEPEDNVAEVLAEQEPLVELPTIGNVTDVTSTLRRELAAVVRRATAIDPDDRYESAAALRDDVNRLRVGQAIMVPVPVRGYRLRKAMRQNPVATALGSLAIAAVLAAIVILVVSLAKTRHERAMAQAAQVKAQQSAQTSQSIVEFMVNVFGSADPRVVEQNGNVTARQLVETGLRRALEQPVDDPRYSARLDLAMGLVGVRVGALKEAKAALIRASAGSLNAEELRSAQLQLALAHGGLGENEQLEVQLSTVFRNCEKTQDSECLIAAHRVAGHSQTLTGQRDRAIQSYRTALSLLPQGADGTTEQRALRGVTLFDLGVVLHQGGQYEQAGPVFDEALVLHREQGGPASIASARAFTMLGQFKNARREFVEADKLLTRGRELYIRLHGPVHPDIAYVEFYLSRVAQELGDLDRALELAESSLTTREARLGRDNINTSFSLARRADALRGLGRLAEAETDLLAARRISKTQRPRSHAKQGLLLARLLSDQGRTDAAIETGRTALAEHVSIYGDTHLVIARTHLEFGRLLATAKQHRAALAEFLKAKTLSAPLRKTHRRHAEVLLYIARMHRALGESNAASAALDQAEVLATAVSPPSESLVKDIAAARRL